MIAQQLAYLRSLMARWDYANTIDFAREEGREEGRKEGQEEGKQQQTLEVARRMLADKVPVETIARYTGLTEEQIAAL